MIVKLLILVSFIFWVSATHAQRQSSDKIYWAALEKYTLRLDSIGSQYSKPYGKKEIFLAKPFYIDSIPPQINGYEIVFITPENQSKLYKEHHSALIHTVIFPIKLVGDDLQITITPYHGILKSKNYNLGVSDGTTVHFRYDCDKQIYVVNKVEGWGI